MARSTYEDFTIQKVIGNGSYGVVYEVQRKADRKLYAMKEVDLRDLDAVERQKCFDEAKVLSSLSSEHIIRYYDAFLYQDKLYIITEYAAKGSLKAHITSSERGLPEESIWKFLIQILVGLNHMHRKRILHRDIKSDNVFLDSNMNAKLGDLGLARVMSANTIYAQSMIGTPLNLSPELCHGRPYDEKSDMWALGVVVYECCTGRVPFNADTSVGLIRQILAVQYRPVSGYSTDLTNIIDRFLQAEVKNRSNTDMILSMPVVRQKAVQLKIRLPDLNSSPAASPNRGPSPSQPVPGTPQRVAAAPQPVSASQQTSPAAPQLVSASPQASPATPQPVSASPQASPAAPQPVSASLHASPAVPQLVSSAPQASPAAPQLVSASPQHVAAAPQPVSASPQASPATPQPSPGASQPAPSAAPLQPVPSAAPPQPALLGDTILAKRPPVTRIIDPTVMEQQRRTCRGLIGEEAFKNLHDLFERNPQELMRVACNIQEAMSIIMNLVIDEADLRRRQAPAPGPGR